MKKTLFDLVVNQTEANPPFKNLRASREDNPARWMLDAVFETFDDPDANFLQQFQTTGFDSRFFELYLFAYFSRSGFEVKPRSPKPDFIVSRQGTSVAIEATTVNPSTSGILAKFGKQISELSTAELREYEENELPIRFGSPLVSKLKAKYWELEQCRDMPFVIAIQAFHDEESLALGDHALSAYLFGLKHTWNWTEEGRLNVESSRITTHAVASKEIPSGFFSLPHAEHISAVVFTNSGTHAKFGRMGYQHGIGCEVFEIGRMGSCLNPDPDAMDSTFFQYNLDDPPLVETWGQGLVALHNPNARHPVPRGFFVDALDVRHEENRLKHFPAGWHPFSSKTVFVDLGDAKREIAKLMPKLGPSRLILAITRDEFWKIFRNSPHKSFPTSEEDGWFSDETQALIGTVFRDTIDNDWGFVILGRDEYFLFRAIVYETELKSRDIAKTSLQLKMVEILSKPQRIFPQS